MLIRSGCLRRGHNGLRLLWMRVVAVSAGLRVLLLLELALLRQLVILLVFFLRLALSLAGCAASLHRLQLAVGGQAGVVFGTAEVLAVLVEDYGGDDERADECKASDDGMC